MKQENPNRFKRLLDGGTINREDPEMKEIWKVVAKTIALSAKLNSSTSVEQTRECLCEIIGKPIDASTRVFIPFHTNFGKHIHLGKNVFINHACSFLDLGGITIEDDVLIGPRVNLVTENHPINPAQRKSLVLDSIVIRKNAWLGAGVTVLPGVTIGENSIVAAGALVTKDVPANTIVGGVPAKIIKSISEVDM